MITGLVQNSQSSRSFNSEVSGQNFESPYSVDLWAIGIFIYELTQGEAPFKDPKETVKVQLNYPTNNDHFNLNLLGYQKGTIHKTSNCRVSKDSD